MEVTLRIPDEVAKRLSADGSDVSRRAIEAVALQGYRDQAHVPLSPLGEADLDREAATFEAASRRRTR